MDGTNADNAEGRAGDLLIVQLWTTDPNTFLDAWRQPTPPTLRTTSRAARNQPIQQFILYSNCATDAAGNCHLTARAIITSPDGTPYGEPIVFEALPASPPAPRNRLGLAPSSIGFVIEDGEQLGRYRIDLSVTDTNAGVTATSRVHLEVVEAAAQ
ncbi:MAG: hypothetical protein ABL909_10735 [Sphingopyxis sp.]